MFRISILIVCHVYLLEIQYYDVNTNIYTFKAKSSILYKDACEETIFLPITFNQNLDGTREKEPNIFQIEVKSKKLIIIFKKIMVNYKNFVFKIFKIIFLTKDPKVRKVRRIPKIPRINKIRKVPKNKNVGLPKFSKFFIKKIEFYSQSLI